MNLQNMVVGSDLSKLKNSIKRIFFYRICGTGMGACACLAKEAGFEVAGADMTFSPPMSTYLKTLDIPLLNLSDLTKEDLAQYDLIVVGNSVPRTSEFAQFVENCEKPFTSFPSFLGEFILKDKEVIGLSGTHGKTTTTYFITQMLEELGEDPGYFVGGIIEGRPPSKLGNGKYFVIEADEYDSAYFQKISKFRLYEMNHMILTSLEFDHADIFNSIEDIKNEFISILPQLSGQIVAYNGYKAIHELKDMYPDKPWALYGENSEAGPTEIEVLEGESRFKLKLGNSFVQFQTNIIGTHNLHNISSCILLLHQLGFNTLELQKAVNKLGMVKRRQEERGRYKGSIVIDDFAHHPKAISLTVAAIKAKYPGKKIVTIFEPISATARSNIFQTEFVESLNCSDEVILAVNSLHTTIENSKNLDCRRLQEDLLKKGTPTIVSDSLESLRKEIDQVSLGDDCLLLILSNRTCLGLWESDFVKQLV